MDIPANQVPGSFSK